MSLKVLEKKEEEELVISLEQEEAEEMEFSFVSLNIFVQCFEIIF
jgi:hypothetical protein